MAHTLLYTTRHGCMGAAQRTPATDDYENNPFASFVGSRPSLAKSRTPEWKTTARQSMSETQKLRDLTETFPHLEMSLLVDVQYTTQSTTQSTTQCITPLPLFQNSAKTS